jgi:hypothetical protein
MKRILSKISLASFLALIMLLVTTFVIPSTPAQAVVADEPECWGVFIGIPTIEPVLCNSSY